MFKPFIGAVAALFITTAAVAEEKAAAPLPKIGLSFNTDTEYNIDTEKFSSDFGVVAKTGGLSLGITPTWDWDASELNNYELKAQYDFNVTKSFTISPYGEYNLDKDWNESTKFVGVKTSIKLN
ncbi:MAG: hypothetical protein EBY41_01290 [Proteobacteria bacterium]|jgi:hypothetical protein|nr:hypothetical protein [Pseudomonadota bacterium]